MESSHVQSNAARPHAASFTSYANRHEQQSSKKRVLLMELVDGTREATSGSAIRSRTGATLQVGHRQFVNRCHAASSFGRNPKP